MYQSTIVLWLPVNFYLTTSIQCRMLCGLQPLQTRHQEYFMHGIFRFLSNSYSRGNPYIRSQRTAVCQATCRVGGQGTPTTGYRYGTYRLQRSVGKIPSHMLNFQVFYKCAYKLYKVCFLENCRGKSIFAVWAFDLFVRILPLGPFSIFCQYMPQS